MLYVLFETLLGHAFIILILWSNTIKPFNQNGHLLVVHSNNIQLEKHIILQFINQSWGKAAEFCGKRHLAGSENDVSSKVNPSWRSNNSVSKGIRDIKNPNAVFKLKLHIST